MERWAGESLPSRGFQVSLRRSQTGGGSKRSGTRNSAQSKGGDGNVDRTPLPAGEVGAEIVRAVNPWTRAGPADDMERLQRNVKGCAFGPSRGSRQLTTSQRAEQDHPGEV